MNSKKITTLGSTGHIGKNLISLFLKDKDFEIDLFYRNSKKLESIKNIFLGCFLSFIPYEDFEKK
jgi:hypothetical protein